MQTKLKRRSDFKVEVVGHPRDLHAGGGIITAVFARVDEAPTFCLTKGGTLIATCESAKRLSDWAFDAGAQSVRHDYHLGLSDGEA